MAKHLVDIDEPAFRAAKAELGTKTIKDTVNRSLRRAAGSETDATARAFDVLARADLKPRDDAWR